MLRAALASRSDVSTSDLFVAALCASVLLGAGGCASRHAASTPAPGSGQKAPARYNLSGYPPSFRDGFNAGCDAVKRGIATAEDKTRHASDLQYKAGWNDGQSICKPK